MSQSVIAKTKVCYHCGESCDGGIVLYSGEQFCCEGCKSVFQILNENNLSDFYSLNKQAGTSQKVKGQIRYDYLDDETIASKLVRFKSQSVTTIELYLPAIHCSSCLWLLENAHKLDTGILKTTINFSRKEAHITFDNSKTSVRKVAELLANIGYPPSIHFDSGIDADTNRHLRKYYYKIGIAFFCFGNIMLLSFPEYFGLKGVLNDNYRHFFAYLNFMLALPVMFYSATEFFQSAWTALKQRTMNMDIPIVLGIIVMFARSSYEIFSQTGVGYMDTLASLVMLMLIGRWFQNKTYNFISFDRDYKSYFPIAVTLLKDGKEQSLALSKLKVGDRIVVRNQELIPADAFIFKGESLVDYSFVTGESTPEHLTKGSYIFAGGKHTGSNIVLEIVKDVSQSYLTQLWNNDVFHKETSGKDISTIASRFSKYFTPIVICIAFGSILFHIGTDIHKALNAFTSVLIITCPCALALSSPFTLGNVLRILAGNNIFIKNPLVVEQVADINTIVFDKTGTLTDTRQTEIEFFLNNKNDILLSYIKSLTQHSTHPLSRKIAESLQAQSHIKLIEVEEFEEQIGKGISAWIENQFIQIGSASFVGLTDAVFSTEKQANVYVSINGKYKGYISIKHNYREGFEELIKELKQGYDVYVLSGDNDAEKDYLSQFLTADKLVFHQKPENKLQFIQQLQAKGNKVMMMGDGLNDAGALKQSNVGIAITEDVNNFSPACDGIIKSSEFIRLMQFLNYSKASVSIIKVSFLISLLYNFVGIYFAVQGTMSPIVAAVLMPISSISIISFTSLSSLLVGNFYFKPNK